VELLPGFICLDVGLNHPINGCLLDELCSSFAVRIKIRKFPTNDCSIVPVNCFFFVFLKDLIIVYLNSARMSLQILNYRRI